LWLYRTLFLHWAENLTTQEQLLDVNENCRVMSIRTAALKQVIEAPD
jgi:hypothetical protein